MNEVVKFLAENPVQYLATVGRDGYYKVAVRVVARLKKRGRVDNCGRRTLPAEVLQKHIGPRENILMSDGVKQCELMLVRESDSGQRAAIERAFGGNHAVAESRAQLVETGRRRAEQGVINSVRVNRGDPVGGKYFAYIALSAAAGAGQADYLQDIHLACVSGTMLRRVII